MSVFDIFKKLDAEKTASPPSKFEYIIIGLGNPGKKYELTRHNAGFLFIDALSKKYSINVDRLKFKSLYGEGVICGKRVCLIKPQTFMNLSGEAVNEALSFYKLSPCQVIVIYDDVALPVGKIRLRQKGSDGGHNGIKSIIQHLKTDSFLRIKIGVSSPPHKDYDLADYVLSNFDKSEKEQIIKSIERSISATEELLQNGIESATQKYN